VVLEHCSIRRVNQVPALGGAVTAAEDVFPTGMGFIPAVPNVAGFTIGSWARPIVLTKRNYQGWWQGKDRLTQASYPCSHGKRWTRWLVSAAMSIRKQAGLRVQVPEHPVG
jgi:hypothetical protein